MDAKALAKSKRAHSQHLNKKHHPKPTSKAPLAGPEGVSSGKKPSGKQDSEKTNRSQGSSALPSNWDRYEEEYDSGSLDPSLDNMSQATDSVPKSKGADYGHLISEAKSQSPTNIATESFPSFDDVLTDFNQGVGSLLSARGQGILSWARDDNFIVEDRATSSHEAPFLSLNLHLLAEQLKKIDLSQRLFIEPDFLSPELLQCTEESTASISQEPEKVQTACQSEGVKNFFDELAVHGHHAGVMSPDSSGVRHSVSASANQGLKSMTEVKDEYGTSVANPQKKSSGFESAVAEAELDMLLDSFGETKFLDYSGVTKKPIDTSSVQHVKTLPKSKGKGPDLSKPASIATDFDDALDDLLMESSSGVNFSVRLEETSTSRFGGITVQSASSQPLRKGTCFSNPNFDDTLDDLLEETPNPTNQKGTSLSHEVISAQVNTMPSSSSSSVPKSKVLDDFDSWFDSVS
ncbi:protein ECERIFERUM 16 isoform X1 [Actinidia eriantha]|uniref:protein ECERIFERUM 16 isoform X1 n=1 Tax=Actinidia eriantha TaxID=165200 RepID=UPI0025910C3D|nr:protein ECERIFERUM 16 isoform X1 [Actinidia eriantha]